MRSLRLSEPVLIWPALVPTAMSAMVESSVSPRAVADDGGVAGALGHLDGGEGFGQRADLVDLDQDRVGDALVDAFLQDLGVGDEQVVADQLHLLAQAVGQVLPAVPVALVHAVFDADDRVLVAPGRPACRSTRPALSARPSPSRWYLPSL